MTDRYNIHSQLEHLQSKYIGTGHSDTTKFDWLLNQHRDTYALFLGHHDMISYLAVVENQSLARKRFDILKKMLQPCGINPNPPEE